jgi:hypothetical protein
MTFSWRKPHVKYEVINPITQNANLVAVLVLLWLLFASTADSNSSTFGAGSAKHRLIRRGRNPTPSTHKNYPFVSWQENIYYPEHHNTVNAAQTLAPSTKVL